MTPPATLHRLTIGLAAAMLAACGASGDAGDNGDDPSATSGDDAAAVESVTLVLDWTPNTNHGGIYLAAANGWYDDVGIDLEIIQPGEGGSLAAVATGNAEFGISVQENLIPARANGVPVVSVAAILQHNTSSLMSLATDGIDGPADLPGHRYGGWGGPLERALIDRLVECSDGDPAAVDFVEVGNTDYRVGMESDAFDVVWIFDGWDKIRLEQAGVEVDTIAFADHLDCIPDWYTPLLATNEELLADDPGLVDRFLAATARGYDAAATDPGAAADALLAAAPELDEELVRASADYLAEEFVADADAWGAQDAQVWSEFADFLTDAGMIEPGFDPAAAYTIDHLP